MATRVIRQETDATFTHSAGWTTGAVLPGVSGGSCSYSTTGGSTYTITLPPNHTFTGCAIIGYGEAVSTTNATISVDGGAPVTFNQKFGTNNQTNYFLPRILSVPITLNPAKGTNQVIVFTAGADNALSIIDGIELYTAVPQTAGRLTSFGHSMLYGVTSASVLGPQTGRFSALFAAYLSGSGYLGSAAWVDDNQGVPSEDLTNGSYQSGNSGTLPYTAASMPQYTNSQYYNNTAIWTPGWMRAEAGELWPTATPEIGQNGGAGSSLMTTAAQYNQSGESQWWARAFGVGIIMHAVNDLGYTSIYDAGAAISNSPINFRDGAGDATAPAAGAGYAVARWTQRMRELLIRAQLSITPAPRIYILGCTNPSNGAAPTPGGASFIYDQAVQAMLAESWVSSNTYFVSPYAAMTGSPSTISGSDFHPNALGHQQIAAALIAKHDSLARQAPTAAGKAY